MVSQHAPNKYGAVTLELNNKGETSGVGKNHDCFELALLGGHAALITNRRIRQPEFGRYVRELRKCRALCIVTIGIATAVIDTAELLPLAIERGLSSDPRIDELELRQATRICRPTITAIRARAGQVTLTCL
jgi:hypothetical protein